MNTGLGSSFHFARQHDQAIEQYRQTLEIDPNFALAHQGLGWAYEQKRMYREAILEFQKASTLSTGNTFILASLSHAYAVAGNRGEALRLLAELQEQSKRKYVSPYGMAIGYTGLREPGQAFEWLEKAFAERAGWLALLNVEPRFDSLRTDPRFANLVQRIGLEP
ncbi:MAG: tetratricopeptide repeat protein [Pyrinomonadaceae bacterium]|nr:tetratricopeptide repeat protein [Pyrinomonadaceae bacterium]